MRNGLKLGLFIVTALILAGCISHDENAEWNPQDEYPAWAYDAPFYYQPAEELKPRETVGKDIPIFYVRDQLVFLRHPDLPTDWRSTVPASYNPETPKDWKGPANEYFPEGKDKASFIKGLWKQSLPAHIELWFSQNAGQHWARAGYFGLEQSHYLFDSGGDGNFWIRFVGAGQRPSKVPPGQPNEIIVVDTYSPEIEVTVSPGPWEDEKKTIPHYYHVGENITVSWSVSDINLEKDSVKLSTAYAHFPNNLVWSEYDKPLMAMSSMQVKIPAEASEQPGIRFRIIAKDKAGNIGLGMSEIMYVQTAQASGPIDDEESNVNQTEATPQEASTESEKVVIPSEKMQVKPAENPQPMESIETSSATTDVKITKLESIATEEKAIPVTTPEQDQVKDLASFLVNMKIQLEKKNQVTILESVLSDRDQLPAAPSPSKIVNKTQYLKMPPTPEMKLLDSIMNDNFIDPDQQASLIDKSNLTPPPSLLMPIAQPKPAKLAPVIKPAPKLAKKEPDINLKSVAMAPQPREKILQKKNKPAPAIVFNDAEKLFANPRPIKPTVLKVQIPAVKVSTKTPKPIATPILLKAYFDIEPKQATKTAAPDPTPLNPAPVNVEQVVINSSNKTVKPATSKPISKEDSISKISVADLEEAVFGIDSQEASAQSPKEILISSNNSNQKNIPEETQLGWPGRGITLRCGVTRELRMPQSATEYKALELQFTSCDGKKWITLANRIEPEKALEWTVPVVDSKNCRLRIIGLNNNGDKTILATSEEFVVDMGLWDTIDLGGFPLPATAKNVPKTKVKNSKLYQAIAL